MSTTTAHATTRTETAGLLTCGVVAAPIFIAVIVAQCLLRDGCDFSRHPAQSVLSRPPLD